MEERVWEVSAQTCRSEKRSRTGTEIEFPEADVVWRPSCLVGGHSCL
jgi:hypothetical protein